MRKKATMNFGGVIYEGYSIIVKGTKVIVDGKHVGDLTKGKLDKPITINV